MSWLFSRALVEEYSEATCSDGEQSAPLSGSHMQLAYLPPDRMTAFSRPSRFGMTFRPLTDDLGEGLLTWFRADFLVKTYPAPERVQELKAPDPACGSTWQELSVRYDLDSSSWRIHLSLFPEDLPWSSVTLPKWGMTRNGFVYQHPTAERPISATESGLWQTPVADDAMNRKAGKWNSRGEPKLSAQVKHPDYWPTPNACNAANSLDLRCSGDGRMKPNKLGWAVAAAMWPTPVASMSKGSSPAALTRKSGRSRENDRLDHKVMSTDGGQLNPMWVEWLMGWPLGWTDLKRLEMDKFQQWQQQQSEE